MDPQPFNPVMYSPQQTEPRPRCLQWIWHWNFATVRRLLGAVFCWDKNRFEQIPAWVERSKHFLATPWNPFKDSFLVEKWRGVSDDLDNILRHWTDLFGQELRCCVISICVGRQKALRDISSVEWMLWSVLWDTLVYGMKRWEKHLGVEINTRHTNYDIRYFYTLITYKYIYIWQTLSVSPCIYSQNRLVELSIKFWNPNSQLAGSRAYQRDTPAIATSGGRRVINPTFSG